PNPRPSGSFNSGQAVSPTGHISAAVVRPPSSPPVSRASCFPPARPRGVGWGTPPNPRPSGGLRFGPAVWPVGNWQSTSPRVRLRLNCDDSLRQHWRRRVAGLASAPGCGAALRHVAWRLLLCDQCPAAAAIGRGTGQALASRALLVRRAGHFHSDGDADTRPERAVPPIRAHGPAPAADAGRAPVVDRRGAVVAVAGDARRQTRPAGDADRAASAGDVRGVQLSDRCDAPAVRSGLRLARALVPLPRARGVSRIGAHDVVAGGWWHRGGAAADLSLPDGVPLRAVASAGGDRVVHHVLAVAGVRVLRAGA